MIIVVIVVTGSINRIIMVIGVHTVAALRNDGHNLAAKVDRASSFVKGHVHDLGKLWGKLKESFGVGVAVGEPNGKNMALDGVS